MSIDSSSILAFCSSRVCVPRRTFLTSLTSSPASPATQPAPYIRSWMMPGNQASESSPHSLMMWASKVKFFKVPGGRVCMRP